MAWAMPFAVFAGGSVCGRFSDLQIVMGLVPVQCDPGNAVFRVKTEVLADDLHLSTVLQRGGLLGKRQIAAQGSGQVISADPFVF